MDFISKNTITNYKTINTDSNANQSSTINTSSNTKELFKNKIKKILDENLTEEPTSIDSKIKKKLNGMQSDTQSSKSTKNEIEIRDITNKNKVSKLSSIIRTTNMFNKLTKVNKTKTDKRREEFEKMLNKNEIHEIYKKKIQSKEELKNKNEIEKLKQAFLKEGKETKAMAKLKFEKRNKTNIIHQDKTFMDKISPINKNYNFLVKGTDYRINTPTIKKEITFDSLRKSSFGGEKKKNNNVNNCLKAFMVKTAKISLFEDPNDEIGNYAFQFESGKFDNPFMNKFYSNSKIRSKSSSGRNNKLFDFNSDFLNLNKDK